MVRRIDTTYLTTAANTNEQKFPFQGIDTYQQMTLRKVFVGLATPGVTLGLYVAGDKKANIDLSRFTAGNRDVDVELVINPQIPLVLSLTDVAGAAHANVPVVIEYDVTTG